MTAMGRLLVFMLVLSGCTSNHKVQTAPTTTTAPDTDLTAPVTYYLSNTDAMNAMNPPQSLMINGQQWHAYEAILPKDYLGETECDDNSIFYEYDADPVALRNTLVHEILHAATCFRPEGDTWWNSKFKSDDKRSLHNHVGIYHLADFLTDFTIMNPEFMKLLEVR